MPRLERESPSEVMPDNVARENPQSNPLPGNQPVMRSPSAIRRQHEMAVR